jgi:hypothetical protein
LVSGEEGCEEGDGDFDEEEAYWVLVAGKDDLLEEVLGDAVDEAFCEETDEPPDEEYSAFHAD